VSTAQSMAGRFVFELEKLACYSQCLWREESKNAGCSEC